MIITAEMIKVRISETGMEYSTPSRPKKIGRNNAKPTSNTTSRNMEIVVDANVLSTACKKMMHALLIHAKIVMQR